MAIIKNFLCFGGYVLFMFWIGLLLEIGRLIIFFFWEREKTKIYENGEKLFYFLNENRVFFF